MIPHISSWYKRKYTLNIGYLGVVIVGLILSFIIFIPIIAGIEITNSRYEERHKLFMKKYEASWNVFPTKTNNEAIHDCICQQLNEIGHNYKDCKIWNKNTDKK